MPPMMLMKTTSRPATASPRTNFEAPSIAPKKPLSSSSALRRSLATFSSIRPGGKIGVDRHLLARHGVEVEARRDFGDAARALGDDDEIHDHQDRENDNSDDEIAAHHEIAERLDDVAGGVGALMAVRQDQPRRSKVERQPQHRRDQQDGRERREFQRRLDEQRRHQDQDRQRDRDRQEKIEHDRGQRQDQHHQDGEDAERQREIAALQDFADFAETGKSGPRAAAPRPAVTSTMVAASPRACRPRAPNVCAAAEGPPFRK